MSQNIKAVPTAEYTAVIATANQYVEGLRIGDAQGVAQAFHKEAVMYGFTNGELLGGPIKNLFDFVEKNGAAAKISTRLDVLAITPTTAVVFSILLWSVTVGVYGTRGYGDRETRGQVDKWTSGQADRGTIRESRCDRVCH